MTNVSVTNIFRGFCHLLSITTCVELDLQNTTDLITAKWVLFKSAERHGFVVIRILDSIDLRCQPINNWLHTIK